MKPINQIITAFRECGEDSIRLAQFAERGMQVESKDELLSKMDSAIRDLKLNLEKCQAHNTELNRAILRAKADTKERDDYISKMEKYYAPRQDAINQLQSANARIKDLELCLAESGTADPMLLATTQDALRCRTEQYEGEFKLNRHLLKRTAQLASSVHEVSAQRDYWKAKHAESERNFAGYKSAIADKGTWGSAMFDFLDRATGKNDLPKMTAEEIEEWMRGKDGQAKAS